MKLLKLLLALSAILQIPSFTYASPAAVSRAQNLDDGTTLSLLQLGGNIEFYLWLALQGKSKAGCGVTNTYVRQEFTSMSKTMRKNFTDAVTCLQSQPSQLNPYGNNTMLVGVRSRFDDYTAGHMQFDKYHHFTATFLHWHRYVIWAFEQDLRTMCGYQGYLPYWDWGMNAQDPANAEIFNGDAYSMGSNGAYIPRNTSISFTVPLPASFLVTLANPIIDVVVPPNTGTGGGCINPNGPFGKSVVNLGPTLLSAYNTTPESGATGADGNLMRWNPRCIKRDINPYITQNSLTYRIITQTITNWTNIADFQAIVQADSRFIITKGINGIHAGGHLGAGGDPFADQPSTPQDPLWFLHHASIDRIWSIWQNQNPWTRNNQLWGTSYILNYVPSPNVTLDDTLDLSYVGGSKYPPITVGDATSTAGGPFCYIYK